MRLIVCVDRDDDLGRKAGVAGPVVGRAAVLDAASRLGIADPEDTDTNAMFAAIHLLDEIREAGDEAEVVVLTGTPKVGLSSDRKVAQQFDAVLQARPATSAHLVSDGAEDEFLFPILASRVKIDGVHRVYVRQSPSIESAYYTITRALKDPKFRAKTVLPFALVLLVLGLAAAAGVVAWGVVALLVILGIYLIFWTFDIDEAIIDAFRSAGSDIRGGSVASWGFGLFALALVALGLLESYNSYLSHLSAEPIARALVFLQSGLIWWFLAGEVYESGRAIRRYLGTGRIGTSYPIATVSIVGLAFLSYGIVTLFQYLENLPPAPTLTYIVGTFVLGLALVVTAAVLSQYYKTAVGSPPDGETGSLPA